MPVEFAISSFNWKTIASLLVIGALIAYAFLFTNSSSQQIVFVGFVGTIAIGVIIFGLIVWHVSSAHMKLDTASLVVGGGLYRVSVPMEQIDRTTVRRWTEDDIGYKPGWRLNGIGMPGFALGWFTSKQSKIFAAIANRDNLVVIPTRAGYTILASPDHPQDFVDKIRAL